MKINKLMQFFGVTMVLCIILYFIQQILHFVGVFDLLKLRATWYIIVGILIACIPATLKVKKR